MAFRAIERVGPALRTADVAVLTGDLTNFGEPDDAWRVIDAVRAHCPEVWAVTGNLDMLWVIDALRARASRCTARDGGWATSASSAAAARTSRPWTPRPSSRRTSCSPSWSRATPPSPTRPGG